MAQAAHLRCEQQCAHRDHLKCPHCIFLLSRKLMTATHSAFLAVPAILSESADNVSRGGTETLADPPMETGRAHP